MIRQLKRKKNVEDVCRTRDAYKMCIVCKCRWSKIEVKKWKKKKQQTSKYNHSRGNKFDFQENVILQIICIELR